MKFSIFLDLQCFSSFLRIQKKLKHRNFQNLLTKDQIIFKNTIVYACLQYSIKQNSFTLLACDLEI